MCTVQKMLLDKIYDLLVFYYLIIKSLNTVLGLYVVHRLTKDIFYKASGNLWERQYSDLS